MLIYSILFLACGDVTEEKESVEGTEPGDCSDLADNDVDGDFDCEDDGCENSPECNETDEPSTEPSGEPSSEEVDADGDGVLEGEDCNDEDANKGAVSDDADCDGVTTAEDCDDSDVTVTNTNVDDADCDLVVTSEDCDDEDATVVNTNVDDADCDLVNSSEDCDDSDPSTVDDMDCDGILTNDDCDDNDADSTIILEDSDCNGVPDDCFLTNCDMSVDLGNGIGADFVLIDGDDVIDPSNRYTLDNAFYMMTTEVTQGMFQELMGYDSRDGESISYGDGDNYPANYASWHMSVHFANTFSIAQGEQECYSCSGSGTSVTCSEAMDPYLCTGYSLPTEHEWEIAARSGTTSEFWTGEGSDLGGTYSSDSCDTSVTIQDGVSNPQLSDYAWFCGNSNSSSQEVGTKLPNGFGLYDMHGSLWEWTSDWYDCTYPNGGTWCDSGYFRVIRGGSWYSNPSYLGLSGRYNSNSTNRTYDSGFRLRKMVTP